MSTILSFFKLDATTLQKWIAIAIGGVAGKFITTLDPSLQGPVGGLITAGSALGAAWLAQKLHLAPPPVQALPAPDESAK